VNLSLDPRLFVAFLLASTRCAAWLSVSPPFQGAVPGKVKAGLALALGMAIAPSLAHNPDLPVADSAAMLGSLVFQVAIGLALGMLVNVMYQAVMAAGSMVDTFAGLTAASIYDPTSRSTAGPMGRMYQTLGTLVLFATSGHLVLIGGFMRTFEAAPLGGFPFARSAELMTRGVGQLVLAAMQIGAPILGALFVTELLLGLASKAAPQLNILVVGFSLKSIVLVMLGAAAFPLVVFAVPRLTSASIDAMWTLVR
jgi:flagellar biosynthetic protein FliR